MTTNVLMSGNGIRGWETRRIYTFQLLHDIVFGLWRLWKLVLCLESTMRVIYYSWCWQYSLSLLFLFCWWAFLDFYFLLLQVDSFHVLRKSDPPFVPTTIFIKQGLASFVSFSFPPLNAPHFMHLLLCLLCLFWNAFSFCLLCMGRMYLTWTIFLAKPVHTNIWTPYLVSCLQKIYINFLNFGMNLCIILVIWR